MVLDPPTAPQPVVRLHDPPAVALGNASLLGVGYLLLGRRKLAIGTTFVTVALVTALVAVASVSLEVVVVLWWVFLVAHGWFLAGGRPRRRGAWRHRLIAAAVTVPVLLAVGLLRLDAARIEREVTDARRDGDCSRAVTALNRRGAGHEVANAPSVARGDLTVQACRDIRVADALFHTALTGELDALDSALSRLGAVQSALPGHERMVERTLTTFLDALPANDPCVTTRITDSLGEREPAGNLLDRAAEVVPGTAPGAIVRCGDNLMAGRDWSGARAMYQKLLDRYAGHELAGKATEGVEQATLALELANVRSLLAPPFTTGQPAYCAKPAPYSGAPPYRAANPNRAMVFGTDTRTDKLPGDWVTKDAAQAVLVMCVGAAEQGTAVQTCPYVPRNGDGRYHYVTFRRIALPVRVFELRTARLVHEGKVEIGGQSCPAILSYTTYGEFDRQPPSSVFVTESDADVHAAFNPLINP